MTHRCRIGAKAMNVSEKAVEAALDRWFTDDWRSSPSAADRIDRMSSVLSAALPFLALRPAPSQSDEDAWLIICQQASTTTEMIGGEVRQAVLSALALVRAEATLAGAAAEREECATLAQSYDPTDKTGTEVALFIGMAIRARTS